MQCKKCGGTGRNGKMTSMEDWVCHSCRGMGLASLRIKTLIHEVCPGAAITTKEKSNEYRKFTEFTIQINADISLDDLSNKFMELHRRVNLEIKDVFFEYAFDFKTESLE